MRQKNSSFSSPSCSFFSEERKIHRLLDVWALESLRENHEIRLGIMVIAIMGHRIWFTSWITEIVPGSRRITLIIWGIFCVFVGLILLIHFIRRKVIIRFREKCLIRETFLIDRYLSYFIISEWNIHFVVFKKIRGASYLTILSKRLSRKNIQMFIMFIIIICLKLGFFILLRFLCI